MEEEDRAAFQESVRIARSKETEMTQNISKFILGGQLEVSPVSANTSN